MNVRSIATLLACGLLAACTSDEFGTARELAEPAPAVTEARPVQSGVPDSPAVFSELANTSWQLVKIMSMDDSITEPSDPSLYTLTFQSDGTAAIQADCNRGTGSWKSEHSGQLQFGTIASTRAMCRPGSISTDFIGQFEWVRSYVIEHGRLFLATMADGAIIEFAPSAAAAVVATVFGKPVRVVDPDEALGAVLDPIFDAYAAANGIAVTKEEIDSFVAKMRAGQKAAGLDAGDELTADEAAQVDAMQRTMGQAIIRRWKVNRSLYDRYGGRIIYQQLGPEPLDAYREFLEQKQRDGDLVIADKAFAQTFWRYFTDDSIHDFMEPGSEDAERAFSEAPWE